MKAVQIYLSPTNEIMIIINNTFRILTQMPCFIMTQKLSPKQPDSKRTTRAVHDFMRMKGNLVRTAIACNVYGLTCKYKYTQGGRKKYSSDSLRYLSIMSSSNQNLI